MIQSLSSNRTEDSRQIKMHAPNSLSLLYSRAMELSRHSTSLPVAACDTNPYFLPFLPPLPPLPLPLLPFLLPLRLDRACIGDIPSKRGHKQ